MIARIAVLAVMFLAACGDRSLADRTAVNDAATRTSMSFMVTEEAYGKGWPLTDPYGTLACERAGMVTIATASGTYALNGYAATHGRARGWRPVQLIWKKDAENPGTRMYLGDLIEMGAGLCSGRTPTLPVSQGNAAPPVSEKISDRITVTQFQIHSKRDDATMVIRLATDLPSNALVMIAIDRPYWRRGAADHDHASYYSGKRTVAELIDGVKIELTPDLDSIRKQQLRRAAVLRELGSANPRVSRIADYLRISVTVPIGQPPPFAPRNANLFGTMVEQGPLRTLTGEAKVAFPISENEGDAIRS